MIDAKLRVEIEKRLDYLIVDAQELVNETGVYKEVEENQMRNLLEMALSVDSIKALEVFIQYQIGRKKLPASFGDGLIEKIGGLEKTAKELTGLKTTDKTIWLALIRHYLGYMNRYFLYRRKEEEEGSEKDE
jgi:CRISPR/Cas system CSM-associated protein Csm2 small subunit